MSNLTPTPRGLERLRHDILAQAAAAAHVPDDRLLNLVKGKLGPEERQAIETHLAGCSRCTATLRDMAALKDTLARLADKHPLSQPVRPVRTQFRRPVGSFRLVVVGGLLAAAMVAAIIVGLRHLRAPAHGPMPPIISRVPPKPNIGPLPTPPTPRPLVASNPIVDGPLSLRVHRGRLQVDDPLRATPPWMQDMITSNKPWIVPASGAIQEGGTAGPADNPGTLALALPNGNVFAGLPQFSVIVPPSLAGHRLLFRYWKARDSDAHALPAAVAEEPIDPARVNPHLAVRRQTHGVILFAFRKPLPPGDYQGQLTLINEKADAQVASSRPVSFLVLAPQCQDSDIALGVADVRAGRLDDALRHFQTFKQRMEAEKNPDGKKIGQHLLDRLADVRARARTRTNRAVVGNRG